MEPAMAVNKTPRHNRRHSTANTRLRRGLFRNQTGNECSLQTSESVVYGQLP